MRERGQLHGDGWQLDLWCSLLCMLGYNGVHLKFI